MKTNQTKGTWQVNPSNKDVVQTDNTNICHVYKKDSAECDANVKLIVAAPKGLQVAINMYVKILMTPSEAWRFQNQDSYVELREFISDATGYSPKHVQDFYEQVALGVKYNNLTIEASIKNQEKVFQVPVES